MSSNLVIVESPAKAKTISRILGKNYAVMASMGHVRDLPKSQMGIDIKDDFTPTYTVPQDKKRVIKDLKAKMGAKTTLYIATDEDREGEAIGWHLLQALETDPKKNLVKRIVFHEITEPAIKASITHPRDIDENLVNAQQARRILDRLVGYELSPLLWKKIRYGLSAGRVQSVAVRLIVEREREVKAFKPEEYWHVTANLETQKKEVFEALLIEKPKHEGEAKKIVDTASGAIFIVEKVEEKEVRRTPPPPFTTSTLQQEASRQLGYSVKKTMMIAQQLYEGVDIGDETKGVITYMRTDSTNLSELALKQAKELIANEFGKEYALETPRRYASKKGAQEAHEAVRPVDLALKPEELKFHVTRDQYRLYDLIWKRTMACQMAEAVLKAVGADIRAGEHLFRATGQTLTFPGFMKAYVEGSDHPDEELAQREKFLPALREGEKLTLKELLPSQHFTKPPPRYTEASLVKKLESEGIGRPSTYAPTISTIIDRKYVQRDAKQLKPTDLGDVVTDLLVKHFPHVVDYKFTAEMEEDLDAISEGKKEWVPVIRAFYKPFHGTIEEKMKTLKKSEITSEETSEKCEKCESPMIIKLGRFGKFLACSNYPECKNTKRLEGHGDERPEKTEEDKELERKLAGKKCDKCGKPMVVKEGPYGAFLGCSGYPKCRGIQPIIKFTGVKCPKCGDGQVIERRARRTKKLFYGCNKYPKCDYASWEKPIVNS